MTNVIGRLQDVGIAVESSRGTAATPTYWIPATDKDFDDKTDIIFEEGSFGVLNENQNAQVVKQWADGSIEGNVGLNSVGVLLTGLAGAAPTTQTSSGEYTHTWTQANNVTNKSLTIAYKDANQNLAFANAIVDSLELTLEVDSFFSYKATFMSKKSATAAYTPSYTADTIFAPQYASVKLASAQTGLGAASAINVRSANIKFDKKAEDKQHLGSKDIADVFNTSLKVTGSLEVYYDGTTFKDYVFNETERALRLGVTNTAVTLANSSNPHLYVDLYKVRFHDHERDMGNDDIVTETVEFTALVDLSNSSKVYTLELLNSHAGTNYS